MSVSVFSVASCWISDCTAQRACLVYVGHGDILATLNSLLGPLLQDSSMAQKFPALLTQADTGRVVLEKRSVKVNAFTYWVGSEDDRDFHVILGSTPQLTTTTVFVNSEISSLPPSHPTQSPFPGKTRRYHGDY